MGLNALFVGSSGLTTNSSALDVVGNNLANINTTGYKTQRMLFKDVVYQTLNTGSAATDQIGGINPAQLGLGVTVGSVGSLFAQGNLTPTGRQLDAGLQGAGFFVVRSGQETAFTRAGSFSVDAAGYLNDPATGYRVQRFGAVGEGSATDPAFQVPGNQDIQIPFGAGAAGTPTATVRYQGNLSSAMQVGQSGTTAIQVYDSQSTARALTVTFTKTAANTYTATADISGGTATIASPTVTFDTAGLLQSPNTLSVVISGIPGATSQTINLNLGTAGSAVGLTQFGGVTTASAVTQDGSGFGTLVDVSIDQDGVVQGKFTNGRTIGLAQLAVAGFNNADGLLRSGQNYFRTSTASGEALVGLAGTGGRGTVQGAALESANVDIAIEFSRLIVAQRGFQVNARTITAANETLQELANILR